MPHGVTSTNYKAGDQMSDKERVEFEAWYSSKYGAIGIYEQWSKTDVIYLFVAWQASAERYQSRIAELEAEVERLKSDKGRIDWLADPCNNIGNVSLPVAIVERNLASLRDAIDEAMKGGA